MPNYSKFLFSVDNFEIPKKVSKRNYINLKSNEFTIDDNLSEIFCSYKILLDDIYKYPVYDEVYNELSGYFNLPEDNIVISAGSHILIQQIIEKIVFNMDEILLHFPNYVAYENYASLSKIPLTKFYQKDVEFGFCEQELKSAIKNRRNFALIFSNPNGFSGRKIPKDTFVKLLPHLYKSNSILIIDEAYLINKEDSLVNEIPNWENLIIIKSFSKSLGVPGLRLGVCLTSKLYAEYLKKWFPETTLSSISINLFLRRLKDNKLIVNDRIKLESLKKSFLKRIQLLDHFKGFNTDANFILIQPCENIKPEYVHQYLINNGVYAALVSPYHFQRKMLRLTIPTIEIQKRVIALLEAFLHET